MQLSITRVHGAGGSPHESTNCAAVAAVVLVVVDGNEYWRTGDAETVKANVNDTVTAKTKQNVGEGEGECGGHWVKRKRIHILYARRQLLKFGF